MKLTHKHFHGFTLIELLAVITIIGILATLAIVGVGNSAKRARDGRRQSDLAQIRRMLLQFESDNGCLPRTSGSTCASGYSDSDLGGWDYSAQGGVEDSFLNFLVTSGYATKVPVDPKNNGSGDVFYGGSGFAYAYYCYPATNQATLGAKFEDKGLDNIKGDDDFFTFGTTCQ